MSGDEELPETAASVLPGSPRIASLDALLREIDGLRLSLETDLSVAAAAVEAGAPALALEVVESQRSGVQAFQQRALGHLADLAAHVPPVAAHRRRRHWATTSVAPLVAAAAAVGLFFAVGPHTAGTSRTGGTTAVSANALGQLTQLSADGGSTAEVKAAATRLNDQLATVAKDAAQDPQAAIKALSMLAAAQQILLQDPHSGAMGDVLARQIVLMNQITAALAPGVALPTAVPTSLRVPTLPTRLPLVVLPPKALPSTSPKPRPKPSATGKPTSAPTSKPSSMPSPSPSTAPPVLVDGSNASNPFG